MAMIFPKSLIPWRDSNPGLLQQTYFFSIPSQIIHFTVTDNSIVKYIAPEPILRLRNLQLGTIPAL
jgi:hypothetical protein